MIKIRGGENRLSLLYLNIILMSGFFFFYLFFHFYYSILSTNIEFNDSLPKIYKFRVINEYPHYHTQYDSLVKDQVQYDNSFVVNAVPFTQGLTFLNSSIIVESAGLFKGSFIRLIQFPSMNIIKHRILEPDFWGEGTTIYKNNILQLTWTSGILISYPLKYNLTKRKLYSIPFVGWGLTSDNNDRVWATTGSNELLELEIPDFDSPNDKVVIKNKIKLTCFNKPLSFVNEMEYIPKTKTIWANIFLSNIIVEINPETGKCLSIARVGDVYDPKNSDIYEHFDIDNDVLNGIAYHDALDEFNNTSNEYEPTLIITGKRWPRMYLIKLERIHINNNNVNGTNFTDFDQYYRYHVPNNIHF